MRDWLPMAALLVLAVACGAPRPAPEPPPRQEAAAGDGAPALLPSLQARLTGDSVRFVLQVTNTTAAPIDLRFSSGQAYDFLVLRGERELWRWSGDMMFTQAMRVERLGAGETLTYEAAWAPPAGVQGELTAVGRLTATSHPLEQRTPFRVP